MHNELEFAFEDDKDGPPTRRFPAGCGGGAPIPSITAGKEIMGGCAVLWGVVHVPQNVCRNTETSQTPPYSLIQKLGGAGMIGVS